MMAAPSMSMAGLSADLIAPMTPELLARLEAWGFDAEEFLKLDLGIGEAREQPARWRSRSTTAAASSA